MIHAKDKLRNYKNTYFNNMKDNSVKFKSSIDARIKDDIITLQNKINDSENLDIFKTKIKKHISTLSCIRYVNNNIIDIYLKAQYKSYAMEHLKFQLNFFKEYGYRVYVDESFIRIYWGDGFRLRSIVKFMIGVNNYMKWYRHEMFKPGGKGYIEAKESFERLV